MSIWMLVWLIISFVMLVFLGWTIFVLTKQKTTWKAFARKYKLRYKSAAMMQAPEIRGVVDDYRIEFFPSEHVSHDVRGSRSLTAIEVTLNSALPIGGVIASGGMVSIAQMLDFKAELRPDHDKWDKSYVALADNKNVLKEYLTPERLDVLTALMARKGTWVMFVFKDDLTLLRVDIAGPLMTKESIEDIKDVMINAAKILELHSGEDKRLKTIEAKASSKNVELEIAESDEDLASGLMLEEDEPDEKETEKGLSSEEEGNPESKE